MNKILLLSIGIIAIISCKKTIRENYPDGTLKFEVTVNSKNQYDGLYRFYDPSGKLKEEKKYVDGLLDGESKEYIDGNKIKILERYEKDELLFSRRYNINGTLIDGFINTAKYNFDTATKSTINIENFTGSLAPEIMYNAEIKNPYIPSKFLRLFIVPGSLVYSDSTYSKFSFKVTASKADSVVFQVLVPLNKKQGMMIQKIAFKMGK